MAGASVAGLATACRLAEDGWTTTVLERRPDLLEGGRAILLQPNGLAALDRLGALNGVRERGRPLSRVTFYGRGGRRLAGYDYGELRHPHPYAIEIRPQELRSALAERLSELGAEPPRLGCRLLALLREGERVGGARYRDGEGREHELETGCVVGADGPGSTVRPELGFACRRFRGSDSYVLGTVDLALAASEIAVHVGPGYADGVMPLRDGTYFWDTITDENRAAVEGRDVAAWGEVYERRVPRGAELAEAIRSWEQLTIVRVEPFWAEGRIAPGAALAGDAAGVVHPHSAQGANLALEDAIALGDALAPHTTADPVPVRLLEPYARARHRKLRRFVLRSLVVAGSMDAPTLPWRAVRAAGWGWNRVGPVRRQLLKRGAGLA